MSVTQSIARVRLRLLLRFVCYVSACITRSDVLCTISQVACSAKPVLLMMNKPINEYNQYYTLTLIRESEQENLCSYTTCKIILLGLSGRILW